MPEEVEAPLTDSSRHPNVLLGVSGSVATVKLKELFTKLSALPANVRIVSTDAARHFFSEDWDLQDHIYGDEDDWRSWSRVGDEVTHIKLREWADVLVIAPLSANTLAKIAQGLCDNLLTCIVRAWNIGNRELFVAPAMNTYMWNNPLTDEHLEKIVSVYQARIIVPVEKTLACGDVGIGAMAHVDEIVGCVSNYLQHLDYSCKRLAFLASLVKVVQ